MDSLQAQIVSDKKQNEVLATKEYITNSTRVPISKYSTTYYEILLAIISIQTLFEF